MPLAVFYIKLILSSPSLHATRCATKYINLVSNACTKIMAETYNVVEFQCLTCRRKTRIIANGAEYYMYLERNRLETNELNSLPKQLRYVSEAIRVFGPYVHVKTPNVHNTSTQFNFLSRIQLLLEQHHVFPSLGNLYAFLVNGGGEGTA